MAGRVDGPTGPGWLAAAGRATFSHANPIGMEDRARGGGARHPARRRHAPPRQRLGGSHHRRPVSGTGRGKKRGIAHARDRRRRWLAGLTAPPAQAGWLPPGVRHSRMRISKPIDAVMLVALIALAIFMY